MKKHLAYMAAAIVAAILLTISAGAMPQIQANSAILMDANSGRILWQKNANERSLIASTTKIMTGLLVSENCDPEMTVSVPEEAVGIEGSSLYLRAGEKRSVKELLYGMMLHSGNDAATALAIHACGNQQSFVNEMNSRAKELQLKNTAFANPHGLDAEENYSTAYDLAILAAAAMENELFRNVVSAKTAEFEGRVYTNHNKLLWRYEGAIGVKTGYTKAAGRILVSCAEREGMRLIAVTINDPNDWQDHQQLFDYGFCAYKNTKIKASEFSVEVPIIGGSSDSVSVGLQEDFSYPLAENEMFKLTCHIPAFYYAPVISGQPAGWLSVSINDCELKRLPLYWKATVLEEV